MTTIRIIAGEREYHLVSEDRVERPRGAVVAAARTGEDVVTVTASAGREVSLLVSAGLSLTLEIVEVREVSEEDDAPDPGRLGFDDDL